MESPRTFSLSPSRVKHLKVILIGPCPVRRVTHSQLRRGSPGTPTNSSSPPNRGDESLNQPLHPGHFCLPELALTFVLCRGFRFPGCGGEPTVPPLLAFQTRSTHPLLRYQTRSWGQTYLFSSLFGNVRSSQIDVPAFSKIERVTPRVTRRWRKKGPMIWSGCPARGFHSIRRSVWRQRIVPTASKRLQSCCPSPPNFPVCPGVGCSSWVVPVTTTFTFVRSFSIPIVFGQRPQHYCGDIHWCQRACGSSTRDGDCFDHPRRS